MTEVTILRKLVKIRTVSENNDATNIWIQHLINSIIIKELDFPSELQAKLLNDTYTLKNYTR